MQESHEYRHTENRLDMLIDMENGGCYEKNACDSEKFQLLFISRGAGIIYLNDRKIFLTAPTILCLNEQEQEIFYEEKCFEVSKLFFHPNVINSIFTLKNIREIPTYFSQTDMLDCFWLHPFIDRSKTFYGQIKFGLKIANRISSLFNSITQEWNNKEDFFADCKCRSILLEMLLIILNLYCDYKNPIGDCFFLVNENTAKMEEVALYLHTNYKSKISIAELTKRFSTNRTTLTKEFKKAFGISPIVYLNKIRIQKAVSMLIESTASISQIIFEVGFNNRDYFNKVFKKNMGCSPNEYRRKMCINKTM